MPERFAADYSDSLCHRAYWGGESSAVETVYPGDEQDDAVRHAREAPVVATATGRVRRQGGLLTVSGARFQDDDSEGDAAVGWTYRGRLAGTAFDLVYGRHWEWSSWTLVDERGVQATMSGEPVPSPHARAFVAAGDDAEGEGLNGLVIADYRNGAFKMTEVPVPLPCDPQWIDDDRLRIKVVAKALNGRGDASLNAVLSGKLRPSDWETVQVVRNGTGWKLILPEG